MKKSFGSPPPAARRRTTSPGTIAGRNIPDLGSHKGSTNHAPDGSEDRDSDGLTQSVRFNPKSIRSTSTPLSGSEDSDGSASSQESEGESAGEDDDGEYDPDTTRDISVIPEDLDGDEQGEVVPETPQDASGEELRDDDDFGGPDIIQIDSDPTGPLPRISQEPAPTTAPRPIGTVLGKRERSLDLAEFYHERLKSSYDNEESEVQRARTLGVETPQGKEALQRATWKRRETRDLRRELRVWVTPPSRPLDPNVVTVSKAFEDFSITMRETFARLLRE